MSIHTTTKTVGVMFVGVLVFATLNLSYTIELMTHAYFLNKLMRMTCCRWAIASNDS